MATPLWASESEQPSRAERSIYGWLNVAGAHRVKAVFGEGSDLDAFARETKKIESAGVRFLFFDSARPRIVWWMVDECRDSSSGDRETELESLTTTLRRLVALGQRYGARIYFITPRT